MDELDRSLIDVIKSKGPPTREEAVKLGRRNSGESEEAIDERILRLERQGKILLSKNLVAFPSSLKVYFWSEWAAWFWLVVGVAVGAAIMVFAVPDGSNPLIYARNFVGGVFVLFLPGYSLLRALFGAREMDAVERLALSVGLSLALVAIVGLLLNYTPWGIRVVPVTLSLLSVTIAFASAAVFREYTTRNTSR